MNLDEIRPASWIASTIAVLALGACTPESTVNTCEVQEDCPAPLNCLQQVCEEAMLPVVEILNPEEGLIYTWMNDGTSHTEILSVRAANLTLRSLAESNERIVGEGHLVVFVDEIEVATIDSGDLAAGVQTEIVFDDTPGVHRLRVQARLNDGTNYDNRDGSDRKLVWVDDGLEHVALRVPWPGDAFSVEEQLVPAEVAVMGNGDISIGPPASGLNNVHVFYEAEPFDACLMNPLCFNDYVGIVPSDSDEFGPLYLPAAAPGTVRLTALVVNSDHTVWWDPDSGEAVYSSIEIVRTDTD